MGVLADRVGRKKVIASSVLGPILQLCWILLVCRWSIFSVSVRDATLWQASRQAHHHGTPGMGRLQERGMSMIWAGSAFLLMGNLSSANATIYAMAADSCPPAQRSRYFYYLYSTFLVCELFAPALASVTIERNLLIPFGVGLASLLTCFPILHVMPETHKVRDSPATTGSRRSSSSSDKDQSEAARETDRLLSSPADPASEPDVRPRRSLLSVVRNRNILLALFVLFIGALRQGTVSVLLQYAAVRFGWPTSRTAMLVSVIAASNIVLFLVILPQTVAFLTSRWHIMPQLIDYNVVSASLVILTVGATFMGLASSMHWLICGRWQFLLHASFRMVLTRLSYPSLCNRIRDQSCSTVPRHFMDRRGHPREHLWHCSDCRRHWQNVWRSDTAQDICQIHAYGRSPTRLAFLRCRGKYSRVSNQPILCTVLTTTKRLASVSLL